MVEPISIAVVAGASAIGTFLGRRTKKNGREFITNAHSEEVNSTKLHFVSVNQNVSPEPLLNTAKKNPVFINLQKLNRQEKDLVKFLTRLNEGAQNNSLLLSKLTNDMVLLRNQELDTVVQANLTKIEHKL